MASFLLLGGALMLGDALPWTVRVLMIVGGLAPLAGVPVRVWARRDPSADYPYPPPDAVSFGRGHRR